MMDLLKLAISPVTLLAIAPLLKSGINRLVARLFDPNGTYFLSLAAKDGRPVVREVGENKDLQVALLAYIKFGSGLRTFFQYILFAYLSITISFLTYQGNGSLVFVFRILLYAITTVILIIVSMRLALNRIEPARITSTRGITYSAMALNALIVVFDWYSKKF